LNSKKSQQLQTQTLPFDDVIIETTKTSSTIGKRHLKTSRLWTMTLKIKSRLSQIAKKRNRNFLSCHRLAFGKLTLLGPIHTSHFRVKRYWKEKYFQPLFFHRVNWKYLFLFIWEVFEMWLQYFDKKCLFIAISFYHNIVCQNVSCE